MSSELNAAIYRHMVESGSKKAASLFKAEMKVTDQVKGDSLAEMFKVFSSKRPAPTKTPSQPAAKKAKVESSSSSSSDSSSDSDSSSSSDSEPVAKKPAVVTKPASKAPVNAVVAAKKKVESSSDSDSDSSSSSSSSSSSFSDDKKKKTAAPVKPIAVKKAPAPTSSSSSSDSSSDSDSSSSSDSSNDKPVVKKNAAAATTAAASKVHVPSAATASETSGCKIYVRGLPWQVTEAELRSFFKACGAIKGVELPLGADGRASGTAFVTFSNKAEFTKSFELDGSTWPNSERWVKITEASEKAPMKFQSGPKPDGCNTVFVGNLPWDVDEEKMRSIFESCGEINQVRFALDAEGNFKGFGHVQFADESSTEAAVKMAGTDLNGRPIRVDFAPNRERPPRDDAGGRGGGRGGGGRDAGGRGGRGGGRDAGGRGGRGGAGRGPSPAAAQPSGKKMTFDDDE